MNTDIRIYNVKGQGNTKDFITPPIIISTLCKQMKMTCYLKLILKTFLSFVVILKIFLSFFVKNLEYSEQVVLDDKKQQPHTRWQITNFRFIKQVHRLINT